MNNIQILKQAIAKAKANGWDMFGWENYQVVMGGLRFFDEDFEDNFSRGIGAIYGDRELLLDHSFAKAFWGMAPQHWQVPITAVESFDGEVREYDWVDDDEPYGLPNYMHHLQQMVISPDPIQYLAKYL